MANDYVYAVTRVHMYEASLLSGADIEAMISAKDAAEVGRLLEEKGWGDAKGESPYTLANKQMEKTWAEISDLVGDDLSPFDVFRTANDHHNLKAAIKLAYTGEDKAGAAGYMVDFGTVAPALILKAAAEHDFSSLPAELAETGREAYETLAHTGNGQACDMVVDRASLISIDTAGKATQSELLREYARLTVDIANIKAAVRCAAMGKSEEFIGRAIAPAGSLDTEKLAAAAAGGMEAILTYLATTPYAGAVAELEKSMASFERWCDDALIRLIRPQRHNYFSIEPLAAYILARQNEVRMVRVILSVKANGFSEDILRERLREMYV